MMSCGSKLNEAHMQNIHWIFSVEIDMYDKRLLLRNGASWRLKNRHADEKTANEPIYYRL